MHCKIHNTLHLNCQSVWKYLKKSRTFTRLRTKWDMFIWIFAPKMPELAPSDSNVIFLSAYITNNFSSARNQCCQYETFVNNFQTLSIFEWNVHFLKVTHFQKLCFRLKTTARHSARSRGNLLQKSKPGSKKAMPKPRTWSENVPKER